MKNSKGFAAIAVIFVLVALIAAVSIGSYFILTNQNSITPIVTRTDDKMEMEDELPDSQEPVSESLDLDTIESELDETILGSPDRDFEAMENDASEL